MSCHEVMLELLALFNQHGFDRPLLDYKKYKVYSRIIEQNGCTEELKNFYENLNRQIYFYEPNGPSAIEQLYGEKNDELPVIGFEMDVMTLKKDNREKYDELIEKILKIGDLEIDVDDLHPDERLELYNFAYYLNQTDVKLRYNLIPIIIYLQEKLNPNLFKAKTKKKTKKSTKSNTKKSKKKSTKSKTKKSTKKSKLYR